MTEHMTISDVIELAALGGEQDLIRFLADPLEVLAEMDGPVLIPAEPHEHHHHEGNHDMTSTTGGTVASHTIGPRTAIPDDAVTSVVGYLRRCAQHLAAEHVSGKVTPASLRQYADSLHIIGGRLLNAADALACGAATMPISDITTTKGTDHTWAGHFPEGREIFYEGDDPDGFRQQIIAEFGFDPADDANRPPADAAAPILGVGSWLPGGWTEDGGYRFHCPPEHLDAIYGGDRFPMGS